MLVLRLQVANLKKESEFHWYREDTEIIPDVKPDLGAGVCKLPIKLVAAPSDTNRATLNTGRRISTGCSVFSPSVFTEDGRTL